MIVIIAIVIAAALFFGIRALLAGPRVYNAPTQQPYIDQGPVIMEQPSPMADIGTMIAADVAANVITDVAFDAIDAFSSGPMDGDMF